jgi:hypothetical protein
MIRLIAGTVVLGFLAGVCAQERDYKISPEQAHTKPISRVVHGERGVSTSSAIINFSELAAQPVDAKKSQVKRSARAAMKAPKGLLGSGSVSTASVIAAAQDQIKALAGSAPSPTTFTNFQGAPDNENWIPPDTHGAVGSRHLMVVVNGEVRIQNRGGATLSAVTLDQFWSRVGSVSTFDPKVFYDPSVSRWFVVSCADAESDASAVLIGVSRSDDPQGNWALYRIDADSNNTYWADYPSVGFNGKWITVAMNMFPNDPNASYGGEFLWAFDKKSLLNGPTQAPFTKLAEPSGFTMLSATTFDDVEPTLYIIETFDDHTLRLSTITGPVGGETLNVGAAMITSSFNWNVSGGHVGQQLGSSEKIDCGDTRMLSCVFRNGALWASHEIFFPATGAPTRGSAQWWQLTVNGGIVQQGLIDDPSGSASFPYPTLAVNQRNDMLIGYSRIAANQFASANYSFRNGTDPRNTLQGEQVLKAGEASYFKDFGSGRNRWGDYSATVVDPLNDQDLWTLQEYAAAPIDTWGTWWGMLLLSSPPDDILEMQVSPPDTSDIAAAQPTDFFATVTDSFLKITNGTVTATIVGRPIITFRNDGVFPDATASDNIYSATISLNPNDTPVVFTATAPGKTGVSVTNNYNIVPRPPNDNFANATKIPAAGIFGQNSAQVQNNFATTEPNEPLHAGVSNTRSLWWNYSTTTAVPVIVDTSGSGTRVVVAVYTGSTLTTLFQVTATNPPPNKAAILTFDAQPGVTYHIVVAAASPGEKGLVRLRVQPNGKPDVAPPIVTVDFPPSGLVTNVTVIEFRGTVVDPTPDPSGVNAVLIHVEGVEPELVIPATIIGTTWRANVPLSNPTNDFKITGVDFANNTSEFIDLTIYYKQPGTTNDLFGSARVLTPPSGVEFASTTNATREFGEPLHGGNEGGASLWWSYTPTKSGVLVLSTAGSDFDTLLGVYTVNDPLDRSFSKLIPVGQNDDAPDAGDGTSELSVAVEAGRLYYIAVDGYGGKTGNVELQYNFSETGVFNLTTSSAGGGTISPGNGTFPANSAVTVVATPDRYKQFKQFIITQSGVTTNVSTGPTYTFSLAGPTQVTAEFETKQFADDFQSGGFNKLPWQISSTANFGQHWIVAQIETNAATHAGSLVARVREGLPDSITASLVLVTNLAPGVGSFEFTVNSETNYDKLEFSLDGRVLGTWSGVVPWQTFFFDIPAKGEPIRLEWRYSKDLAITAPNELVAIDNVDVTLAAPPAPAPLTVSISADASQVTIIASGPPNTDFRLETSTNLTTWSPVADSERNSGPTGITTFIQPAPTGTSRFYRVVQL